MTEPTTPMPPEQPTTPAQPTAPQPPVPPQAQPQPQLGYASGPQPTAQKKARVWWVIGGVSVLALLLCFGGCGVLLASTTREDNAAPSAGATSHAAAPASTTASAPTTTPAWTPPPVVTYATPTKADFKLKVKILRKQCFGSAGCNITYRIDVTYTGAELDPSKTYEVTYAVKGAEDPIVNTLEVTGDSASVPQEEMASTRRSGDKLTAVVTAVSEL